MKPLSGSDAVREGPQVVNNNPYANSIADKVGGCEKEVTVEYNLGRQWKTFHAVIGLSENSGSDTKVQFQYMVDGAQVGPSYILGVGEDADPPIPVEGAQRLELIAVMLEGDMDACSDAGLVVWGDARVVG